MRAFKPNNSISNIRYKFVSYYKYGFILELEDGKRITNTTQDYSEVYRLWIDSEGDAFPNGEGTGYQVDGIDFKLIPGY